MNSHIVSRRLHWRGLVVVLFLLLVLPAQAGPAWKTTDTTETTTPSTGDINPTSAPVVDDDFDGLTLGAIETEPTLVSTIELSAYTDDRLLAQIDAAPVHRLTQGAGVVVAVLDAGFQLDHPALAPSLVPGGWDFVDDDPDPRDLGNGIDDDKDGWVDRGVGHGTTVATTILSVAPKAGILPLRVRDDEGRGGDRALLNAIEYAMKLGVDVINLSVNDDIYDMETVRWIIAAAKDEGIIVVASAGNDGLDYLPVRTITEANLVVGAVDSTDTAASFSNYDETAYKSKMVLAPGVDLLGPMVDDGVYTRGYWSGTSFAAGVVSGAVALVRELRPEWNPWDVQVAVVQAVVPVRSPDGKKLRKIGRLDLPSLVQR